MLVITGPFTLQEFDMSYPVQTFVTIKLTAAKFVSTHVVIILCR